MFKKKIVKIKRESKEKKEKEVVFLDNILLVCTFQHIL